MTNKQSEYVHAILDDLIEVITEVDISGEDFIKVNYFSVLELKLVKDYIGKLESNEVNVFGNIVKQLEGHKGGSNNE